MPCSTYGLLYIGGVIYNRDWYKLLMAEKADVFDLIVVGAGPAGLTAGKKATDLGLKVLIVDSDLQVCF